MKKNVTFLTKRDFDVKLLIKNLKKKNFKFIDYLQIVKNLLDCKLIKTK